MGQTASLGAIRAAKILSVKPHPKADRLRVCTVDDGSSHRQVNSERRRSRIMSLGPKSQGPHEGLHARQPVQFGFTGLNMHENEQGIQRIAGRDERGDGAGGNRRGVCGELICTLLIRIHVLQPHSQPDASGLNEHAAETDSFSMLPDPAL